LKRRVGRELGFFSLEKRRLQGDDIVALLYLKEVYRKAGDGHFVREYSDKTRSNAFNLKKGRIRSDRRSKCFTLAMVRHCVLVSARIIFLLVDGMVLCLGFKMSIMLIAH